MSRPIRELEPGEAFVKGCTRGIVVEQRIETVNREVRTTTKAIAAVSGQYPFETEYLGSMSVLPIERRSLPKVFHQYLNAR